MSIHCMSSNSLDFSSNFAPQNEIASNNYTKNLKSAHLSRKLAKKVQEEYAEAKNPSTDCSSDSDQAGKLKTDETKYKTEMCKNFQATGNCNYGKKCKFAHGKQDLVSKPIQSSKSYKTKTCKAFHEEFNCPYGSRCHFKHDQRNIVEIQQSKFYARRLMNLEVSDDTKDYTNSNDNNKNSSDDNCNNNNNNINNNHNNVNNNNNNIQNMVLSANKTSSISLLQSRLPFFQSMTESSSMHE